MIRLENISKEFKTKKGIVRAVDGINLHVKKGEIHGVIGYSGAGKSTLIRCVNLLERPTAGKVWINNVDITSLSLNDLRKTRQKIGMIFQHFNLLKTATVYNNIAIPLKLLGYNDTEVKNRVAKYAEIVGLTEKLESFPSQLSGGQKQRVAIARALAQEPEILLSDEATSALDPETTEAILELLLKINRELGITILLITHEMNVIQKICDDVSVLEAGKVVEYGSAIDLFAKPQHPTTRKFLSTISQRNLSPSLIQQLNVSGSVIRLTFLGESTGKPLLAEVSKVYDVQPNILTANIIELKNGIVGNIVVHLNGEAQIVQKALTYFTENGVAVEELGGEQNE
ncbi:methionine ABC transporter ATP-binding protein [Lysinibacillus pakistanensis]|uniref:ATP-binding cassette domain-containing protein n=1 Tax=Lysinibacillus pakistanensis TaxID=759811 RepID=A0AAX3WWG1_9BACI|nr:ATP-binding cassette domain-containing protein [Lysinibacillus pakistanensis]MDM5231618.1 ATP-binding cassette domain-containing protein [Lysinibacillus pakistanensis]WHY47161.1 ATP-binding cassette domain-containing protein [Lysinibacillus pakistanensis]WHY52171.1 ATP-binding cassette domain-containing protein [Lysinibacillus pakistanensis]